MDVITQHIYDSDDYHTLDGIDGPLNLASIKGIIDANGGSGKPVWITETGWTSNGVGEEGREIGTTARRQGCDPEQVTHVEHVSPMVGTHPPQCHCLRSAHRYSACNG